MNIYQQFGTLKAGRQLPLAKSKTHGTLLWNGSEVPGAINKPFALLQFLRSQMIMRGIPKKQLKIVSMIME